MPRLDVELQRLVGVPEEVAVGALLGAVVGVGPAPGVATLSGCGTFKCSTLIGRSFALSFYDPTPVSPVPVLLGLPAVGAHHPAVLAPDAASFHRLPSHTSRLLLRVKVHTQLSGCVKLSKGMNLAFVEVAAQVKTKEDRYSDLDIVVTQYLGENHGIWMYG